VAEIRQEVFSFMEAGGTVTAVGGSQGCAVIDTGYGPRVAEIRKAIGRRVSPTLIRGVKR
jgi:glyoxylase-like metal-dependent hydrolase (beta-lactamase superfamily II)